MRAIKSTAGEWIAAVLSRLQHDRKYQIALLAAITLLAAGLRLYKLGEWSLWIDEIFTLQRSLDVFDSFARFNITHVLIGGLLLFLDSTEFNARLAPALVGVVSVPALFFSVERIFNWRVALITALLLAVSPWHILWSQHVRFYAVLMFLYSIGLLLLLYAFEKDSFRLSVVAAVMLTLAVIESAAAFFFIPVLILYGSLYLLMNLQASPGLRFRNVMPLSLPVIVFATLNLLKRASEEEALTVARDQLPNPEGYSTITVLITQFVGDARLNPMWMLTSIVDFIGLPIFCLAVVAGGYLLLSRNRQGLYVLVGAVVPLVILFILSFFVFSNDRYIFHTLPFWLILAAIGINELFNKTVGEGKLLVAGVLLALVASLLLQDIQYFKYQNGYRHDWKGAFQIVQGQKREGDIVAATYPELGEYYLDEEAVIVDSDELRKSILHDSCQRLWFVDGLWGPPESLEWLRESSQLIAIKDVPTPFRILLMRVYLFEPENTCEF